MYQQKVEDPLTAEPHNHEESADHNWYTLKKNIMTAAEESLGMERKKQPNWFLEASDTLSPLLEAKNAAHMKMLKTNTTANQKAFQKHQRIVKKAVDVAKEEWVVRLTQDAGRMDSSGGSVLNNCRQHSQDISREYQQF